MEVSEELAPAANRVQRTIAAHHLLPSRNLLLRTVQAVIMISAEAPLCCPLLRRAISYFSASVSITQIAIRSDFRQPQSAGLFQLAVVIVPDNRLQPIEPEGQRAVALLRIAVMYNGLPLAAPIRRAMPPTSSKLMARWPPMTEITAILSQIESGDPAAADHLLSLVYTELRRLATAKLAQEKPGQTLQATALVHEAWLRLVGGDRQQSWNGRNHFFAAAAEAMRRILVEQARRKNTAKHGGDWQRIELRDECGVGGGLPQIDLLALDEALSHLEKVDGRAAEIVKLRFFGGLSMSEAAAALDVSLATAENDWAYAKGWLKYRLSD